MANGPEIARTPPVGAPGAVPPTFDRILVPLDGSVLAERALAVAEALARSARAGLLLVRAAAAKTLPGAPHSRPVAGSVEEAEAYLEREARALTGRGIHCETAVRYGDAPSWIIEEAVGRGADLIAMSTHGGGGIRRWVYASTTQRVLERSPVPVLLVRAWQPEPPPPPDPPRLLVPLDGSAYSEAALPVAATLARSIGGEIVLLRVVPAAPPPVWDAPPPTGREDPNAAADAAGYLRRLARTLAGQGVGVRADMRAGEPPRAIIEAEAEHGAMLTVMATHGSTGASRLMMGSVANSVVRRGSAPPVLVRPRGAGSAAEAEEAPLVTAQTRLREVAASLSAAPVVVRAEDSLRHVAEVASQHPATGVIAVVRPGGVLAGLLPVRALAEEAVRASLATERSDASPGTPLDGRAAEELSVEPASVPAGETVRRAQELIARAGYGGLPVTDREGRVVGYADELELALLRIRGREAGSPTRARG